LALLVDGEGDGVLGWIQIETHDVIELFSKTWIVAHLEGGA